MENYKLPIWYFVVLVILLLTNLPSVIYGKSNPFKGYKKANISAAPLPVIINPEFEQGGNGWRLPGECKIDQQGGRNGSAALKCERIDSQHQNIAGLDVKLRPGVRYRYSAWIKSQNIFGESTAGKGATVCLQFKKNGKWIKGSYTERLVGTNGWTYISGVTVVPEVATDCILGLFIKGKGVTGKAWFDDVDIRPVSTQMEMHVVAPPIHTITSENSVIKVNIFHEDEKYLNLADSFHLHFRVIAGDVVRDKVVPVVAHLAEAYLTGLPVGKAKLELTLVDPLERLVYSKKIVELTVADAAERTVPENACLLDSRGRVIVKGKPFLPVGLYVSSLPKEDMVLFAKSPFNCVMPYNIRILRKKGEKNPSLQAIREGLDLCHDNNIKVIFSLRKGYRKPARAWFGAEGNDGIVRKAVTEFSKHPALLAWYISDEVPLSMVKEIEHRRQLLNQLDPYHPTWGVYYQYRNLPRYGSSSDVIGVDPYPIVSSESRDMDAVEDAMDAVDLTGLSVWGVPQLFNWGVYKAKGDPDRFKSDFADPSEEQMRAISIFMALRGAKGFIFYAYHSLKYPLDPRKFNPPPQVQADFDRRWAEVCAVAKMLRDLESFLLAEEDAPAVTVTVKKGKVQAREFRDNKGNIRILIAGIGPGKSEAVITTTTPIELKSVYGNCVKIANNKYRFIGRGICSDILAGNSI